MMLLSYSIAYADKDRMNVSSTGEGQKADTTVVVSIDNIRLANAKMIERNYLLIVVNEQDSIIKLKNLYIDEQYRVINSFKIKLNDANKINSNLYKDLDKQKTRTKILGGCFGAAIVGLLIGVLVN